MKVALYARVSTDDKQQDPNTQLLALREFCGRAEWEIVKEYVDKARAKDYKHRTAWAQLLKDARDYQFKTVVVFRLDRAFRSSQECQNTVHDWLDRGIGFKSLREDVIDTTTSQGKFVLAIMSAVAELESDIISQRVTAGIRRTRAEGNRYGRKTLEEKRGITSQVVQDAVTKAGSLNKAAQLLKISRRSLSRIVGQKDSPKNDGFAVSDKPTEPGY